MEPAFNYVIALLEVLLFVVGMAASHELLAPLWEKEQAARTARIQLRADILKRRKSLQD